MTQLGAFLADLRFVACGGSLLLYALWLLLQRPGLVGVARLGLVIGFGATVLTYAVSHVPVDGLPFTDFFLFMVLALFLIMEFLFQLSVLGVLVAATGTAIASMHYWWSAHGAPVPPSPVVAYWWLLRDLAATAGLAGLLVGTGAGVLLHFQSERRMGGGKKVVHPNDLKDMTGLLARGSLVAFFFALVFNVTGLVRAGHVSANDGWTVSWLAVLFVAAIAWVAQAESRRYTRRHTLVLCAVNLLGLLAYALHGVVFSSLTGGPRIP